MRLSKPVTLISASLALLIIVGSVIAVARPRGTVLVDAQVSASQISPNADGENDAVAITYRIRRDSMLSIYFEDGKGRRHYFRRDEARTSGNYRVLFSGIVDGYVNAGEEVQGTVTDRLLADGTYQWTIEASDLRTGRIDRQTGPLIVEDAEAILPDIWEFTISPPVFTPNQDGLHDRVWINVSVPKAAEILVYLIDEDGKQIFIPEFQDVRAPGEEGRHSFEYDGGIDNGSDPPPDGIYEVLVEVVDSEGQRVKTHGELEIRNGGVPLAEIVAQPVGDTVRFSGETIVQGDVLLFELTVENYGDAPIRTTGPEPGHIYEQTETYSATGAYQESGAWRIGIMCDTCMTDYPWRWALGDVDSLTPIESDGQVHYYLMPGQRAVVTGGIRLTNIVPQRNPQQFWAGLIHEDVDVINNRVDPHWIMIEPQLD